LLPVIAVLFRTLACTMFGLSLSVNASAGEVFRVTLASEPPAHNRISTAPAAISLEVAEGTEVRLARASGLVSGAAAIGPLGWVSVDQVPRDAESLRLVAEREEEAVRVTLAIARREGDRLLRYESTLHAVPGEWLPLWRPAEPSGARRYGTQHRDDSLWLLVETP
jgi:hypothetical protein